MGAKQSKRSVDISGKEADGAGEVAAAGAGGEGRMEPLADADALKPQLNGDAHIHDQTDKEKELERGTPENEKDATTEKEAKDQEDGKEKETTPVTNGEGDQKAESGESTPTEEGKKPKKEKVKKKWSLRSISFSRKDKPKQEKKQKEEETKTNGEPEKVPEETVETTPESPANEVGEEVQLLIEAKDDKAPETPVTEPITNGSTTPESAKVETSVAEQAVVASFENDRPESKSEIEPEQLHVKGLSLVDPIPETTEIESKIEEILENKTDTTEVVPVPESPTIKEVCVTQLPLIEPSPPPLPANPPPSSVASFAASTMAPELTDASLSNTETTITPQMSALDVTVTQNEPYPDSSPNLTVTQTNINEPKPVLTEFVNETLVTSEKNTNDNIIDNPTNNINTNPEDIPHKSDVCIPMENHVIDNTAARTVYGDCEKAKIDSVISEIDKKDEQAKELTNCEKRADGLEILTDDIIVSKIDKSGAAVKLAIDNIIGEFNTDQKQDAIKLIADDIIEVINPGEKDDAINITDDEVIETVKIDRIEAVIICAEGDVDQQEVEQEYTETAVENINAKNNAVHDSKYIQETASFVVEGYLTRKNDYIGDDGKLDSIECLLKSGNSKANVEITITEPSAFTTDDIDDLPPPPPVEDIEVDVNDTEESQETNIEIVNQTNKVNDTLDAAEINNSDTIVNKNKASQEENIDTHTETVGEAIESLQFNGLNDAPMTVLDIADPTHNEYMTKVESEETVVEKSMPPPVLEDTDTMEVVTDADCKNLLPPVAELCPTEVPSAPGSPDVPPVTPQDLVCEKMGDLITEVSTAPEVKTETLQETSKDVVVAN